MPLRGHVQEDDGDDAPMQPKKPQRSIDAAYSKVNNSNNDNVATPTITAVTTTSSAIEMHDAHNNHELQQEQATSTAAQSQITGMNSNDSALMTAANSSGMVIKNAQPSSDQQDGKTIDIQPIAPPLGVDYSNKEYIVPEITVADKTKSTPNTTAANDSDYFKNNNVNGHSNNGKNESAQQPELLYSWRFLWIVFISASVLTLIIGITPILVGGGNKSSNDYKNNYNGGATTNIRGGFSGDDSGDHDHRSSTISYNAEWDSMVGWPGLSFPESAGNSNVGSLSECKNYCAGRNAKLGRFWHNNKYTPNCNCYKSFDGFCPEVHGWASGGTFFADEFPYCM